MFHTAKAAEYSLEMAESSEMPIARAHLADAAELISFAETLRERARHAGSEGERAPTARRAKVNDGENEGKIDGSDWHLTEKPNVKLEDIAGLDDVKKALRDNLFKPNLHPEGYERYKKKLEKGVLMYGPPGNGKTLIAKAIAGELDAPFFNIDAASIKDKYVGGSEKNVKRLFKEVAAHERAVVFIDECESLLAGHENQKVNILNGFLTEMDGIATRGGAFVIGATNVPWLISRRALRPNRLAIHIYVGLPDMASRAAILMHCLGGVPTETGLPLAELAARLEGYSGADIAWICERAKQKPLDREIASGVLDRVTYTDLDEAVRTTPRSVTPEEIARFEEWTPKTED